MLLVTYLAVAYAVAAYAGTDFLTENEDRAEQIFALLGQDVLGGWDWVLLLSVATSALASTQTTMPPGGVGEEAGEARDAIEEFDAGFNRPAVAAAEAAGLHAVVQVIDDRPAQALVAAADEHDAEVIVVGTWSESPLRGLLLGSVAHKLLQRSDRPVLCVPGGH